MKKVISGVLACLFVCQSVVTAAPTYLNGALFIPSSQQLINTTPTLMPPVLKGMRINPDAPLDFEFILDTGDAQLSPSQLEATFDQLVKYYLAALTIPQEELWVNLSPYEQDRIVSPDFGATQMGRDLLAQDYLLKQLTSSLMHPDDEVGVRFWRQIFQRLYAQTGQTTIPTEAFHKVWIAPDFANIVAQDNQVWIAESRLKVMLERDYVAEKKAQRQIKRHSEERSDEESRRSFAHAQDDKVFAQDDKVFAQDDKNNLSSDIMRETILPIIEQEINEGAQFAPLRQIYHAMVLAVWMKRQMRAALQQEDQPFWMSQFIDQAKVAGLDFNQDVNIEHIYAQYLSSASEGVYSLIKEDIDPVSQQAIPRHYVAGGGDFLDIDKGVRVIPSYSTAFRGHGDLVEGRGHFQDVGMVIEEFVKSGIKMGLISFVNKEHNYTPLQSDPVLSFHDKGYSSRTLASVRLKGFPVNNFQLIAEHFTTETSVGHKVDGRVLRHQNAQQIFIAVFYNREMHQVAVYNSQTEKTAYIQIPKNAIAVDLTEHDFYEPLLEALGSTVPTMEPKMSSQNQRYDIFKGLTGEINTLFKRPQLDLIDPVEGRLEVTFTSGSHAALTVSFSNVDTQFKRLQQTLVTHNDQGESLLVKFVVDSLHQGNYLAIIYNAVKRRVTFFNPISSKKPDLYSALRDVPQDPMHIPNVKAFIQSGRALRDSPGKAFPWGLSVHTEAGRRAKAQRQDQNNLSDLADGVVEGMRDSLRKVARDIFEKQAQSAGHFDRIRQREEAVTIEVDQPFQQRFKIAPTIEIDELKNRVAHSEVIQLGNNGQYRVILLADVDDVGHFFAFIWARQRFYVYDSQSTIFEQTDDWEEDRIDDYVMNKWKAFQNFNAAIDQHSLDKDATKDETEDETQRNDNKQIREDLLTPEMRNQAKHVALNLTASQHLTDHPKANRIFLFNRVNKKDKLIRVPGLPSSATMARHVIELENAKGERIVGRVLVQNSNNYNFILMVHNETTNATVVWHPFEDVAYTVESHSVFISVKWNVLLPIVHFINAFDDTSLRWNAMPTGELIVHEKSDASSEGDEIRVLKNHPSMTYPDLTEAMMAEAVQKVAKPLTLNEDGRTTQKIVFLKGDGITPKIVTVTDLPPGTTVLRGSIQLQNDAKQRLSGKVLVQNASPDHFILMVYNHETQDVTAYHSQSTSRYTLLGQEHRRIQWKYTEPFDTFIKMFDVAEQPGDGTIVGVAVERDTRDSSGDHIPALSSHVEEVPVAVDTERQESAPSHSSVAAPGSLADGKIDDGFWNEVKTNLFSNEREGRDRLWDWLSDEDNWEEKPPSSHEVQFMFYDTTMENVEYVMNFTGMSGVNVISSRKHIYIHQPSGETVVVKAILDQEDPNLFVLVLMCLEKREVLFYSDNSGFEAYVLPPKTVGIVENDRNWMDVDIIKAFEEARQEPKQAAEEELDKGESEQGQVASDEEKEEVREEMGREKAVDDGEGEDISTPIVSETSDVSTIPETSTASIAPTSSTSPTSRDGYGELSNGNKEFQLPLEQVPDELHGVIKQAHQLSHERAKQRDGSNGGTLVIQTSLDRGVGNFPWNINMEFDKEVYAVSQFKRIMLGRSRVSHSIVVDPDDPNNFFIIAYAPRDRYFFYHSLSGLFYEMGSDGDNLFSKEWRKIGLPSNEFKLSLHSEYKLLREKSLEHQNESPVINNVTGVNDDLTDAMIEQILNDMTNSPQRCCTTVGQQFKDKGGIEVDIKLAAKRHIYLAGLPEEVLMTLKPVTFMNRLNQQVNVIGFIDPNDLTNYLMLAYNRATQMITMLHSRGHQEQISFRDFVNQGGSYTLQAFMHSALWWEDEEGNLINEAQLLEGLSMNRPTPLGWASSITDQNPYWEELNANFSANRGFFERDVLALLNRLNVEEEWLQALKTRVNSVNSAESILPLMVEIFNQSDTNAEGITYGIPLKIARLEQRYRDLNRHQGRNDSFGMAAMLSNAPELEQVSAALALWRQFAVVYYLAFLDHYDVLTGAVSAPVVNNGVIDESVLEPDRVQTNAEEQPLLSVVSGQTFDGMEWLDVGDSEEQFNTISVGPPVVPSAPETVSSTDHNHHNVSEQHSGITMAPAEAKAGRLAVTFELEMALYELVIGSLDPQNAFTVDDLMAAEREDETISLNRAFIETVLNFWEQQGVLVVDRDIKEQKSYRFHETLFDLKSRVFHVFDVLDSLRREKLGKSVTLNQMVQRLVRDDYLTDIDELDALWGTMTLVLNYWEEAGIAAINLNGSRGFVIDFAMNVSATEGAPTGGVDFANVVWDEVIDERIVREYEWQASFDLIAEQWRMRLEGVQGLVPVFDVIQPVPQPVIPLWGFHVPQDGEGSPFEPQLAQLSPAIKE